MHALEDVLVGLPVKAQHALHTGASSSVEKQMRWWMHTEVNSSWTCLTWHGVFGVCDVKGDSRGLHSCNNQAVSSQQHTPQNQSATLYL